MLRKPFLALTLIVPLLLPVGGCSLAALAEGVIGLPSGVLTQSIQNPITKGHLLKFESGLTIGVVAFNNYKDLCENRTLPPSCIGITNGLQKYIPQMRKVLGELRVFVRRNDQVSARIVLGTLRQLIESFRTEAAANGLAIPQINLNTEPTNG